MDADAGADADEDEELEGHEVRSIRLSDNGNVAVVVAAHGTTPAYASVWCTISRRKKHEIWGDRTRMHGVVSADVRRALVVLCDSGGLVAVYSTQGHPRCQKQFEAYVTTVFLSSDEQFVVAVTFTDLVLLRANTLEETGRIPIFLSSADNYVLRTPVHACLYEDMKVALLYEHRTAAKAVLRVIDLRTSESWTECFSWIFSRPNELSVAFVNDSAVAVSYPYGSYARRFNIFDHANGVERRITHDCHPIISSNSKLFAFSWDTQPMLFCRFAASLYPLSWQRKNHTHVQLSNSGSVIVGFNESTGRLEIRRRFKATEDATVLLWSGGDAVWERFKLRDGDHAVWYEVMAFLA